MFGWEKAYFRRPVAPECKSWSFILTPLAPTSGNTPAHCKWFLGARTQFFQLYFLFTWHRLTAPWGLNEWVNEWVKYSNYHSGAGRLTGKLDLHGWPNQTAQPRPESYFGVSGVCIDTTLCKHVAFLPSKFLDPSRNDTCLKYSGSPFSNSFHCLKAGF